MKLLRKRLFLVFCLVSSVFSYALFLKSYFPFKQGLSGHASVENVPDEPVTGRTGLPTPVYHRLVLMVVDGLRADFVLGDAPFMPFTQNLLHDGRGVSFYGKTHLPTVTLPRIKAMTSGSIPGFVDVVLNFGSPALSDDNLVTQLKLSGKNLTFFGDDTWLRLFPDHFTRADGTTSFFVTDYTEVDVNVTRHLGRELEAEDWDVMVLHYLGLDHLGHLYAPEASLFAPKLREMDDVVHQIYSAMSSWDGKRPAALVVTGDHGISDQGGHGGASAEETSVPVVLLSPHTIFQPPSGGERLELQQIDLCPTLSALLGLPIPRNNLGRVEVRALPLNTPLQDQVRHLQLNAAQLLAILEQNVGSLENDPAYHLYRDALSAHSSWLLSGNSSSLSSWEARGTRVLMGYQDAVWKMSQRIGQTSTSYDMYGIVVAIFCLWMNLIIQGMVLTCRDAAAPFHLQTTGCLMVILPVLMAAMLSHVTICTSQCRSDILCGTSIVSLIVQLVTFSTAFTLLVLVGRMLPVVWTTLRKTQGEPWSCMETALAGSVVVHAFSLLSSSFVEEEHQTWYFFTSTFHTLLLLRLPTSCLTAKPGSLTPSDVPLSDRFDHGDGIYAGARPEKPGTGHRASERKTDGSQPGRRWRGVQTALSLLGILLLCRILRRWNQTGNKWLDVPDVGDWLVRPENKLSLSLLVVVSLSSLALTRAGGRMKGWLLVAALAFIYLSKAGFGSLLLPEVLMSCLSAQGVVEARLAYVFILCLMVHYLKWPQFYPFSSKNASPSNSTHHIKSWSSSLGTSSPTSTSEGTRLSCEDARESHCHQTNSCHVPYSSGEDVYGTPSASVMNKRHKGLWEGMQAVWLCVMCLLLRSHNVVQVAMISIVEKLVRDFVLPFASLRPSFILLYCLMMGQTSFFFQGNSNSLSTVDVSAGLTALNDYQPMVIGLQIAMATYAGLVFWLLSALKHVTIVTSPPDFQFRLPEAYTAQCRMALLTRALPLAVYTVLVTLMRYHLFVWTVFSPKLLYEGALILALTPFCLGSLLLAHSVRHADKEKV